MTEVVISGDTVVRKAPAPPETIKVDMPPPVAPAETIPQDNGDIRLKRISDPIESGEDGRGLREAIRRQEREPDPITEWRADSMPEAGSHESFGKQIRRASESMMTARLAATAKEFSKVPGATEESAQRAAQFLADPPPVKVIPVGDNGQAILPLLDDQPVRWQDDVSFRNMAEANRAMRNYRDAEDRAAQALADELTQRQEQLTREAEQVKAQEFALASKQEAARTQQVQAAHAAAATRAQQEAAALQQVRQMSLNEAQLAARIQQHEQQIFQRYPEVLDWQAWEHTQKTNPARAAEIQREGAKSQAAVAQFAKLQEDRRLREYALGQHQVQVATAQRAAWNEQQDSAFQNALAGRHPQFSSDTGRAKLQRLAREYLEKDLGLTKAQIDAEWSGGALRSAGAQMMLADAVAHRAAKESLRDLNSRRAPVPEVQRPGVSQPRGAVDLDRIANLQRQLGEARGDRAALEIARKLTQAKRAAGELYNGD